MWSGFNYKPKSKRSSRRQNGRMIKLIERPRVCGGKLIGTWKNVKKMTKRPWKEKAKLAKYFTRRNRIGRFLVVQKASSRRSMR